MTVAGDDGRLGHLVADAAAETAAGERQFGHGRSVENDAAVTAREREGVLGRIRAICLGLPETSERFSHGAPPFFVRAKRPFVMDWDELTGIIEDVFAEFAPPKLAEVAKRADP